jgi:hypothetical protein
VSQYEYFSEGSKNQNSTFYISDDGSKKMFSCLSVKNTQNTVEFLLASMKSLTSCEILPFINPLQEAWSGFSTAACDSKNCSESRL